MSRWLEREDEKAESGMETSLSRSGGGAENRPRTVPEPAESADFGDNQRERVLYGHREYWVRRSENEVLFQVGRFRTVDTEDLRAGVYGGKSALATADIRSLIDQGLMKGLWIRGQGGRPKQILALTKEGAAIARSRDPRIEREGQAVYSGHVKIAEMEHDALLYRAYLAEGRRLRPQGATIRRIVLDYELKKELFSRQQRQRGEKPYRDLQAQTAQELSLPIVDGHVALPDFRIEYENEQGEPSRVDIEVATGNYRQAHLAMKAQAGFRIYAPQFTVQRGGYLKGNIFGDRPTTVFAL